MIQTKTIITMNSNKLNTTHFQATFGQICPVDPIDDVTYDYDDEDSFSDISYDSTMMEDTRVKQDFGLWVEDEEEFEDDSDDESEIDETEDARIKKAILLKRQNEKYAKMLEGLSILKDKLNWLDKVPYEDNQCEYLDDSEYPPLNTFAPTAFASKTYTPNAIKPKVVYHPASHIEIRVGETTRIVFKKLVPCKLFATGKCTFGDKCKFVHDKANKVKPLCKNGVKCTNKKCTFIHPERPSSPKPQQQQRAKHASPKQEAKPQEPKKMWLCKNMFKVTPTSINYIGECKFGSACIFSHSKEELAQTIEECKFKENCKSVNIVFLTKDNGKKVRRYETVGETRKCGRLHPKERVDDFIKRTQAH